MKKVLKKVLGEKVIKTIKYPFLDNKIKNQIKLIKKRRSFYSNFLTEENDIYFDIGANIGNRIEPIIDKNIKIIAVEPQPKCINVLKKKFGDKITIIKNGVGRKEEVKTMYISNAHTISSFSQDWIDATKKSGRFSQYEWNKEIQIEMTTLDILINKYGTPKFIKIDVEGFELDVLNGLTKAVEYISFEYTFPERKQAMINCIDRIIDISKGYNLKFNYSFEESMNFSSNSWLTASQMKAEIEKEMFKKSSFGDIYSRIYK